MKFKVGDLVRITTDSYNEPYDDIYGCQKGRIKKIAGFDGKHYYVLGDSNSHVFFNEDELELVENYIDNPDTETSTKGFSAYEKQEDTRNYNVGASDYAKHKIQPWDIWLEYDLNPWDADIVKRVLRTKEGEDRKLDYEKIIHICKERIRQLGE